MNVKFTVDDGETLRELRERFPERFMKRVAVMIKNLARNNAQEQARRSHGRSFWQREVVQSIHEQVNGNTAEIYSDSYKAEHAHTGGVIRPVTRKYLAIPLDRKLRNKGPKEFSWRTKDGEPVFLPRRRGPGWVMGDYAGRGKNKHFTPRFALVPETAPQKPRPWWPTEGDITRELLRFFEEDF